jgi:CHAT domain-containing protein/tetratricopeptide (TPR) repeat protein
LCVLCFVGCTNWQSLYDDANLKLQQGYYDAAIQKADVGYRQSRNKDPLWSWRFRILKAEALLRNRQAKESADLLGENPPPSFPTEITARKRIIAGQALCRLKQQSAGEAELNQAEGLIPSSASSLQAELAFARGNCAFATHPLATQYFKKAAELADGRAPFIAVSAAGNIGYLASQEGRHDEAIDWLQGVVPVVQAAHSQLLEEKTFGNLGVNYIELGDYKRAIENSERAERIASDIGQQYDQEAWLVDLGVSYDALTGDYPGKAEASYLKALSIARKLHDADMARRALHDLSQLAIKEHDVAKAEAYCKQEVAQLSRGVSYDIDASLDLAEIAVAQNDLTKAEQLFQGILENRQTNALRRSIAQEQLGKIYWRENNPTQADRLFLAGIRTVEDEISRTREEYRVSFLDKYPFFDSYIRFLVSQGKPLEALRMAEHNRALALGAHYNLNIAAVQHTLKARHQILLDYQVTDDESFLWVVTPNKFKIFHLPSHQELHSLIDAYNKAIQEQRKINDSFGGQELYKALILPAEALIPPGSQVVIIPSKILSLVDFETLIVPGSKPHYWIEDVVIQNLGSLSEMAWPSPIRNHPAKELLLIGGPEEVNSEFRTLMHADEEIARVRSHFPARLEQVISGPSATPESYKSSNPQQYRFIHFVTHGIASEKVPMDSAIVLSGHAGSYKLYARDIISMPIHADLVTISACYGAGKRWYVSEGMVGLGWAFTRAGARQVVAALWEVDDSSMPQLMDDFYSEIQSGKTIANALHSAKLKMLHSDDLHSRPYYWASLQLYSGS